MGTDPSPADRARIEHVATGQRLLILSIIVNLVATFSFQALWRTSGGSGIPSRSLLLLIALPGLVIGAIGLLRVTLGLGYPLWWRVLLVLLLVVPLISLLVLVMVNARATRALRAAGYSVGLLGARRGGPRPDRPLT